MAPELKHALRTPFLTMLALLLLLLINGLLGTFFTHGHAWVIEVLIAASMIVIVIVVSMEAHKEPPIIGLFSGLGFFWVAILLSLTVVDYLTR
jgi:cytochrome c oxidase subunit 4